jgi:SnoaL-like domain
MLEGTAAIFDRFYDAWNRHDAAAVAASFAAGGVYTDPLTRIGVHGDSLTARVAAARGRFCSKTRARSRGRPGPIGMRRRDPP